MIEMKALRAAVSSLSFKLLADLQILQNNSDSILYTREPPLAKNTLKRNNSEILSYTQEHFNGLLLGQCFAFSDFVLLVIEKPFRWSRRSCGWCCFWRIFYVCITRTCRRIYISRSWYKFCTFGILFRELCSRCIRMKIVHPTVAVVASLLLVLEWLTPPLKGLPLQLTHAQQHSFSKYRSIRYNSSSPFQQRALECFKSLVASEFRSVSTRPLIRQKLYICLQLYFAEVNICKCY